MDKCIMDKCIMDKCITNSNKTLVYKLSNDNKVSTNDIVILHIWACSRNFKLECTTMYADDNWYAGFNYELTEAMKQDLFKTTGITVTMV